MKHDQNQMVRELPHSKEAEEALLGSILIDGPTVMAKCQAAGIRPAAFCERGAQVLYERLADMHDRGVAIEAMTLVEELKTAKQLEEVGGVAYVVQVSGRIPTTAQVHYFIEQVKFLWEARTGIVLARTYVEDIYNDTDGREGFKRLSGNLGQRLIIFGRREEAKTMEERVADIEADVVERIEDRQDKSRWLYTGMPTFDAVLRPLGSAREDQMVGVIGGSSQGKSALLRQFGDHFIHSGRRGVVFTRETSIDSWIEQAAASRCRVDLMNPERTTRAEKEAFMAECKWLREQAAGKLLWCFQHEDSTPLGSVKDLEAQYRAFVNLHGPPDFVMVDYLQLFDAAKRCNNREQEVADVSHRLQALCRSAGNVWIIAAQMNETGLREQRTIRRDEDGKVIHRLPQAGDLRESQAFFHDLDRALAIYRPPVNSADDDNLEPAILRPEQWLCQIKRRRGGTGVSKCWFNRSHTRFEEFTRHELTGGSGKSDWLA